MAVAITHSNPFCWRQVGPNMSKPLEAAILSPHAREDVLGIWIYPGPWQSWSLLSQHRNTNRITAKNIKE